MSTANPFFTLMRIPDEDGTYPLVPIGDGFAVWRRFATDAHSDVLGVSARLRIETDLDGTSRCTAVSIHGDDLTSNDLRLPLARLVRQAVAHWALPVGTPAGSSLEGHAATALEAGVDRERFMGFYEEFTANARRPRRGAPITDAQLEDVATRYRKAIEDGDRSPTRTVADQLVVGRSTAARWIAKARERGMLGPALRATAGEQDR
jgi:hypothetical protein